MTAAPARCLRVPPMPCPDPWCREKGECIEQRRSAAPVLRVGSCEVTLTPLGFHVTREGVPVPPAVHPPALLTFASKTRAREFAACIDADDMTEAHRLIEEHGRWWG